MNQKKLTLCKVISIIGIVIGALGCVGVFILMALSRQLQEEGMADQIGLLVLSLFLIVAILIINIALLLRTKKQESVKGLLITTLVIYALNVISSIGNIGQASSIFPILINVGLLVMCIVALNMKDPEVYAKHGDNEPAEQPTGETLDMKIEQLKKLKDSMTITEEQYQRLIKELLENNSMETIKKEDHFND